MASFKVVPKPSIEKDLRSLPKSTVLRVFNQIEKLGEDPFPSNTVKLEGAKNLFRIRVGDYRLVYEVDRKAKQVIIHHVRHRRDVYRKL
jgi:mRNA interferase RelE/StbE